MSSFNRKKNENMKSKKRKVCCDYCHIIWYVCR